MAVFRKRIVRPGTYTVRRKDGTTARHHVGPKRFSKWIENFNSMRQAGLEVPAPWHHEPKAQPVRLDATPSDLDAYNNGGFWKRLWVDQKDNSLWGEVDVPRAEDADRFNKTVNDVSLLAKPEWLDGTGRKYEDALTHIALVTHPVDKDSEGFVPADNAIALSLQDLYFADEPVPKDTETGMEVSAATASVKDVIRMLQEPPCNLRLPDDTNSENFLERISTALVAVQGAQEGDEETDNGSIKEPSKKAKEQPGPVAMAQPLELALSLLSDAQVTNPRTNKPYTAAELTELAKQDDQPKVTLQLSSQDQAAVDWARKVQTDSYKSRIEKCVREGRILPAQANEFAGMLDKGEIAFAFGDDGKPLPSVLDTVLKSWEAIPAGSVLTGNSPTAAARDAKGQVFGEAAFSLASAARMEEPDSDPGAPMTDEEVDKVVDQQFTAAGLHVHSPK